MRPSRVSRPARLFRLLLPVLAALPGGIGHAAVLRPQEAARAVPAVDSLPPYISGALSLYGPPPTADEVEGLLRRWSAEGGLRSPGDSLLAARLLGRALEGNEALAWLPAARDPAGPGSGPWPTEGLVSLERGRLLLLLGEAGRRGAGAAVPGASEFWAACEAEEPAVQEQLWLDLRAMLTPGEQKEWRESVDRCPVVRRALEERALRSAVSVDDRLAVHYRRLASARARYWIDRPRFLRTASDYRGRPEDLELDDRGLIWVRLGEPDDRVESTEPDSELLGISEDWVYERSGGVWLFHFAPCSTLLREPCMPRSGHALVESFGPLARPGTDFFQRYVMRLALDPLPLRRRAFDSGLPTDALDASLDAAERALRDRQARMLARELQTRAITRVPDVPDLAPDVDVAFEALRFWTPTLGEATVWFVATAAAGQLAARAEPDGLERRSVRLRLATGASGAVRLQEVERRVDSPAALPDGAGIDVFLRAAMAPGRVPFTLALQDGNRTDPTGNWLQDTLNVPDFGGARGSLLPALSDIAVAPDSGGAWTRDGRVFLPVSAAHVTGPGGAMHVYFEVYGIRPGAPYDVELRLVERDDAERMWALDPDDLAYRIAFRSEMPGEGGIGRHHLRLDLADTRRGLYVLAIRAGKPDTGERSLPVTTPVAVTGRD